MTNTSRPPSGDVVYTRMGNQVDPVQLPRTGYCQWCGRPGAQFETFRPEGWPPAQIAFRTRAWFVCGREHRDSAIGEEIRAELQEQWDDMQARRAAATGVPREDVRDSGEPGLAVSNGKTPGPWKVMDRYCWRCGTHRDVTTSATRCSTCGELQRLYIREGEGEPS